MVHKALVKASNEPTPKDGWPHEGIFALERSAPYDRRRSAAGSNTVLRALATIIVIAGGAYGALSVAPRTPTPKQ